MYFRLCRYLSERGYNDLKIMINGEEINTIKCLFCGRNKILNNFVNNKSFNGCLILSEKCSKEGFLLLESYYSGGIIELNQKNCVKLLNICLEYNESGLEKECEDYIFNHLNDIIIKEMLNNKYFNYFEIPKIKKCIIIYLKKNINELLKHIQLLPFNVISDICDSVRINNKENIMLLIKLLCNYKNNKDKYITREIIKMIYNIQYYNTQLISIDEIQQMIYESENDYQVKCNEITDNIVKDRIIEELKVNLLVDNNIMIKNDILNRLINIINKSSNKLQILLTILHFVWISKEELSFKYIKSQIRCLDSFNERILNNARNNNSLSVVGIYYLFSKSF